MSQPPTVLIDDPDAMATILKLQEAIADPDQMILIGGWAVKIRLTEYQSHARPTQDIDALLSASARPAHHKLAQLGAKQDDPKHSARLSGLPMTVDLLTSHPNSGQRPIPNGHDIPNVVTDDDNLNLAVPTMAHLLSTRHSPVTIHDRNDNHTTLDVAGPGALLAGKIATLGAEDRRQEKRYSDADDALRLLSAIPASRIHDDFQHMTTAERDTYNRIGADLDVPQLARLAALSGHHLPPGRVEVLTVKYRNTLDTTPETARD